MDALDKIGLGDIVEVESVGDALLGMSITWAEVNTLLRSAGVSLLDRARLKLQVSRTCGKEQDL
jgi:hypothetical protein